MEHQSGRYSETFWLVHWILQPPIILYRKDNTNYIQKKRTNLIQQPDFSRHGIIQKRESMVFGTEGILKVKGAPLTNPVHITHYSIPG